MSPQQLDQLGLIVGAVLTLAVFSYLLGDNFLYRMAIHLFVGVAAAFLLITSIESVLVPWVNTMLLAQPFEPLRAVLGAIPFLLGLMLLFKSLPRLSGLGTLALTLALAIGTTVAVWGAINGTLLPLIKETANGFKPNTIFNAFITLFGTITVLIYFTYIGARRSSGKVVQYLPIRTIGLAGQAFIAITLGATYALLMISSLTILNSVIADRLLVLLPGR